jgi:diguanylate cyclase (GGDEF)-like protein/PAS domain S-box-containing protein
LAAHDLSTLFDLLPIGAYRSNYEGKVVRLNAALARLNGFKDEAECLAYHRTLGAHSYVLPGRRQQFRDILEAQGQVVDFVSETYSLRKGERFWMREHAHLVRDAHGKTLYIEGTVEDITRERAATQSLQHSENLLRDLLETIPDRVWLKDIHGIHLTCNSAFAEHFDATTEQIIGTRDAHWVGDALAQEFFKVDRTVIETGQTVILEGPMPSRAHDDPVIFEVFKTPMRGSDGRISGVLGIGRNIQARKDTEARLRDATEQLELALMGADLGRWDHDLRIEKGYYLDERSCVMLGRDPAESQHGRAWGHLIHPDDLPGTLDSMHAHLSGTMPAYEAEYRARHTAGHWVWMGNRGKVVQVDQVGKPLRMVGTLMDISKRKLVESELLATQAKLQATLKEIEHLAFHDALTGLPNRRIFSDRIETALAASQRNQTHGALLFLDLDKFKDLNDTYGHDAGDLMLQEVAQRLLQCIRAVDTVARLGGDEFVVLIQNLSADLDGATQQTTMVGHKILFRLSEPYQLDNIVHGITPSIGATLFLGCAVAGNELLKQADMAMYEAKAQGRNTLCFFKEKGL